MANTTTYRGSCHCGAVRFEAKCPPITGAMSCNCSYCRKSGGLLSFIPASHFMLQSGEESLVNYQFNRKVIDHLFCRTCGIGSFGRGKGPDGTAMVALNVRCLDDVDLDGLEISHFDGKSL